MGEEVNRKPIVLSFSLIEDKVTVGEGQFAGKDYYIVPSVMLVEGAFTPAISGTDGPAALYFDGGDISDSLNSWNGRPVSLYHPYGSSSCNDPAVLDVQGLGYVFNVRYEEESKKLKADIWIDKKRGTFIIDKVIAGDQIELSVGAFGDIIHEDGVHNGVVYNQRMTNIIGDHLAILPDIKGACSWENGCGIRMQDGSCAATTEVCKGEKVLNTNEKKEVKMEKVEEGKAKEPCHCLEKEQVKVPVTMNELIAQAPEEMRSVIVDAMKEREEQRGVLISAIDAYEEVSFCGEFLAKADTKTLKSIAALACKASKVQEKAVVNAVDYSLRGSVEKKEQKRCVAPSIDFN